MDFVMRASLADPSISGPPISSSSTDERPPLLTPDQGRIVRETFTEFILPNADQHAIILFLIVFDISPDGRNLFSYVRNSTEPAPLNKRLQEHATHAFGLMCEAIMQMDDADAVEKKVTPKFMSLGCRHLNYGVAADDTPIFRTAFLKTLGKAMGARWRGVVEDAWSQGFDLLEYVVCKGMDK
ncbi:unnamed protein product [Closterium sp. Yama58-4]|nr:unnamed protein product [Closterium sp. Yama58-4]